MKLYDLINLFYNDNKLCVTIFHKGDTLKYTKGNLPYDLLVMKINGLEIYYEDGIDSFVFLKVWLGE